MPALVVPSTIRASLIWTMGGTDYAVNVLHYLVGPSTVLTQTDATDFAADAAAAFSSGGSWRSQCSSQVALARITLRDLRVANLPEWTATVGVAGTNANVPLPPQTSVCVTLRTALAGRRYRGRVFLPGAHIGTATTGGAMLTATATGAFDMISDLVTVTVDTQEWSLGVMSVANLATQAVTSVAVRDNVFDTQRRRSYPGI